MFSQYSGKLSKTELFNGIGPDEIPLMLDCLNPRVNNFKKGDYIVIAGDLFESIGIVLQGEALVLKENAAGDRVVMTILHEGDLFGEIIAFSNQKKWQATVQAQGNCLVLFLPRVKIVGECDRMCPWHRTLINNFLKLVSERALMLNKKVEYLSIKGLRGKISTYLLEQYKKTGSKNIVLALNRNELADFLNVSRPSMSREICKMRDEGIIDFHLTAFRILDVEALKRASIE